MKKLTAFLLCTCLLLCLCACGGEKLPTDMAGIAAQIDSLQVADFTTTDKVTQYVKLTVRDYGELVICLREDFAPISVSNFQRLVGEGFYNGLTIHRVYPGFMIQGGSTDGQGYEGSDRMIKGEFSQNGVENTLSHIRGVVSMARRSNDMNSGSSQFFIMHADYTSLDGGYAAFGYVVAGLSTVDRICQTELTYNDGGERSQPVSPIYIESAEFVALN